MSPAIVLHLWALKEWPRIGWIFAAREQMLEFNVPVALALESMMVSLRIR